MPIILLPHKRGSFQRWIFAKSDSEKRDQYQRFVRECQIQTKSALHILLSNCLSETLLGTVRLMLLKLPSSLSVFTDAAFTCFQNDRT